MRRIVLILAVLALALGVAAPTAGARVVPPSKFLYGQQYDGWLVNWGTAAVKRSLQARTSLVAAGGYRCGLDTGRVWFLPASIDGVIHVDCTIPRGHHLLVPVGGTVDWMKRPAALIASSNAGFDTLRSHSLTVDGSSLAAPVVKTPIFVARIPQSNWLGLPAGSYNFRVKARMVILSPPAPGHHTISTLASFSDGTTYGMTYHLTVK